MTNDRPMIRRHQFWLCILLSCFSTPATGADSIHPDPLYRNLNDHSRLIAERELQMALETAASGQIHRWQDGINGTSGTVRPVRTFRISTGHYCREYTEVIYRLDEPISDQRIACRDDGGIWIQISE